VPTEKLHITYNFLFPSKKQVKYSKKIQDIYGQNIEIKVPYFLYVGNIQPGKNIEGMINGFTKFKENEVNAQLIIVGKPTTFGERIMKTIKGKDIYYLGYCSREIVEYLMDNCKAVVLLSFCEGFGIPPLEGFGYGKPALVSNRTSLPEVVGKAGLKVDPYSIDSIAEGFAGIYNNDNIYKQFIPEQLKKFDYHFSVEQFMKSLGISYI